MPTSIGTELVDHGLDAPVRTGRYGSERELLEDAVEALLAARPHLRVASAVELVREGRITLSWGAELAGGDLEEFKAVLAESGVPLLVDEEPAEVLAGAAAIAGLRISGGLAGH